jgi:type II secretory pathway component PulF
MSESSVLKTSRKKAATKSEIKKNEADTTSDVVAEVPSVVEPEIKTEEIKKEQEVTPTPATVEPSQPVETAESEPTPKKIARPFSKAKEQTEERNTILASSKFDVRKKEVEKEEADRKRPKSVTEQAREKKAEQDIKGSKYLSITSKEKITFAKHLAIMLDSGIPLREALEVMGSQVSSKSLQRMLTVMIRDLSDGFTLSSSLEKFPRVFKPFSVSIIRVGESSGTLPNALHYQAQQLEKSNDLEGKLRGALIYPAILLVGAIGVSAYLAFGILPKIMPMFTSLKVDLPPTTKILLAVSGFITTKWMWIIGVTGAVIFGFLMLYKIRAFKYFCHKFILKIPVFGPLLRAIQVAFFTRILGILLTSGVQIVQALAVASVSASNLVYQKELKKVSERVERGESITDELEKMPNFFPRITTGMIKVGDRTGHLAQSLMNAAEFSEKEVDEGTKTLATLIEPIALLLIGGLVGFIALSIITPMYKITEGIEQ